MSVPNWFRLSPIPASLEQAFAKTEGLRALHQLEPKEIARLSRDNESGRWEFQEDSVRQLRTDEDPLRAADAWDGFALSCFSKSIRVFLYLYFWKWGAATALGVEVDHQVPYVRPEGMAAGEWLERFMCDYVNALGSTACVNGREWPYVIEPLDVQQLLSRWKKEGLPKPPSRGFYMVATSLLGVEEAVSLRRRNDAQDNGWLRYFQTSTGYHVFSTWSRRNWWAPDSRSPRSPLR